MKEISKKYTNEVNGLIKDLTSCMTDEGVFGDLDDRGWQLMLRCYKIIQTSNELVTRMSEVLDEQNEKLDKLLILAEKRA